MSHINSPNALEGNEVSKCDTASADYQSKETGLIDYVGSQEDILSQIRMLVSLLPSNNVDDDTYTGCEDDLNRVCADLSDCAADAAVALSRIADDQIFFETKADYGKNMVTGFMKLNGATVGAVANRTAVFGDDGEIAEKFDAVLSPRGAKKAAEFVKFCDAFNIPVLTLTNVKGFMATKCAENNIAKAVASLTYAFAEATVPKVNVIVGDAFGSAYVAMNSKSIGADMVYAWPNAKVGVRRC